MAGSRQGCRLSRALLSVGDEFNSRDFFPPRCLRRNLKAALMPNVVVWNGLTFDKSSAWIRLAGLGNVENLSALLLELEKITMSVGLEGRVCFGKSVGEWKKQNNSSKRPTGWVQLRFMTCCFRSGVQLDWRWVKRQRFTTYVEAHPRAFTKVVLPGEKTY